MSKTPQRLQRRPVAFSLATIVLAVIGWYASFSLTTEYIHTLQNPSYVPSCNISPLVSCGPNMDSWQGHLFGFSNTLIGLAVFVAPIVVAVALLGGARFTSWFWWLYLLGQLGGIVFVFWLSWHSIFRLGTLCPWCMVVWAVMIPLFWMSVSHAFRHKSVHLPHSLQRPAQVVADWAWVLIIFSYLFIAVEAQIGVDWIMHLRIALR